jgi:hypothetical protein
LGGGWDRNCLNNPDELSLKLLDTIFPDIPVALMSKDYHSKLCNSLALKIAGICKDTANPKGGLIEHNSIVNLQESYESANELIDPILSIRNLKLLFKLSQKRWILYTLWVWLVLTV